MLLNMLNDFYYSNEKGFFYFNLKVQFSFCNATGPSNTKDKKKIIDKCKEFLIFHSAHRPIAFYIMHLTHIEFKANFLSMTANAFHKHVSIIFEFSTQSVLQSTRRIFFFHSFFVDFIHISGIPSSL